MKHTITKVSAIISAILLTTAFTTTTANAKTAYHVYLKDGVCKIDMRNPKEWKKAKGADWQFVGKDSTRSGAKKKAKNIGC